SRAAKPRLHILPYRGSFAAVCRVFIAFMPGGKHELVHADTYAHQYLCPVRAEPLGPFKKLRYARAVSKRWRISKRSGWRRLKNCGISSANGQCPLYPRKRTCAVQLGMSALGQ